MKGGSKIDICRPNMGAKFQIKYPHTRIWGQTFDHVLRADGKLPIRRTHIHDSSYPQRRDHIPLGILVFSSTAGRVYWR